MADILLPMGGGGGGASDECTATRSHVLAGYKAVTADSNDEPAEGLIPSMGGQTIAPSSAVQTVSCSGKYMTGNITVGAIPSNYVYIATGQTSFSYGTFGGLLAAGMSLYKTDGGVAVNIAGQGYKMPINYYGSSKGKTCEAVSKWSIDFTRIRQVTITGYSHLTYDTGASLTGYLNIGYAIKNGNSTTGSINKLNGSQNFAFVFDTTGLSGYLHLKLQTYGPYNAVGLDSKYYAMIRTIKFDI